MIEYFDRVAARFGYLRVADDDDIDQAREMLAGDRAEAVLHELELAYLRRREALGKIQSAMEFHRALEGLLVAAAAKVARDVSDEQTFKDYAARGYADETEFAQGAARTAAASWEDAKS